MAEVTPLEYAIQLERDGQEYYTEAAGAAGNPLGKAMFEALAADERRHEQVLRQLAEEMDIELPAETPQQRIVTIFANLAPELREDLGAAPGDSAVIEKAIELEARSVEHYAAQATQADSARDKAVYEQLALEERQHITILRNTLTYLNDTGQWFLWDEGALLDGG